MEHVLAKHIMNHLHQHQILTPCQHGFRKFHSCESQLLVTLDDLMAAYDRRSQVDVAVLDFCRAFEFRHSPTQTTTVETSALWHPRLNSSVDSLLSLLQRDASSYWLRNLVECPSWIWCTAGYSPHCCSWCLSTIYPNKCQQVPRFVCSLTIVCYIVRWTHLKTKSFSSVT